MVGLAYNPSRRVAYTEIQNLAPLHHVVERLHQLRDACGEVPPVDVEQVNIVGLKLLERSLKRQMERLRRVAREVGCHARPGLGIRVQRRELCGNDHLSTAAALLHPLTDPGLGLFVLVVVRTAIASVKCSTRRCDTTYVSMKLPPWS